MRVVRNICHRATTTIAVDLHELAKPSLILTRRPHRPPEVHVAGRQISSRDRLDSTAHNLKSTFTQLFAVVCVQLNGRHLSRKMRKAAHYVTIACAYLGE